MIRKLQFCSIFVLFTTSSSLYYHSNQQDMNDLNDSILNIYNQPLQACGSEKMSQGSWDQNYKCSEESGGVHQICIQRIAQTTNRFSLNTGQQDWSSARGTNNHCVCLGAWSLYVSRKNRNQIQDKGSKQLKCQSIPRIALTKKYVKNFSKIPQNYQGWEKWNGLELQNQIVDGVNELFKQCSAQINEVKLSQLQKNYCSFAQGITELENSQIYIQSCKQQKY